MDRTDPTGVAAPAAASLTPKQSAKGTAFALHSFRPCTPSTTGKSLRNGPGPLSLHRPAFAFDRCSAPNRTPLPGEVPAIVRGSPASAKSPAPAPTRQPKRARLPASFAGTDGFAYFCRNKSRSPKAKPGILNKQASTSLSPRKAVPRVQSKGRLRRRSASTHECFDDRRRIHTCLNAIKKRPVGRLSGDQRITPPSPTWPDCAAGPHPSPAAPPHGRTTTAPAHCRRSVPADHPQPGHRPHARDHWH
jgi:hypothetical protein